MSFLYAIQMMIPRGPKPVKVGFSIEPERRLLTYSSEPYPVEVLGFWTGSRADEQDFHKEFADVRLGGEWFEPTPEVLNAIQERIDCEAMLDSGVRDVYEQQQDGETYYQTAERLWGHFYKDLVAPSEENLEA